MAKDFLGRGWAFPVGLDIQGKIKMSEHEEDIKESIRIILFTAKGERVMRPDFGCGIHDYVFEAINTSVLTLMRETVMEALIKWEPRIELMEVKILTDKLHNGQLIITIDYRVRTTNNRYNLVFPFYLTEGK